MRPVYAQGGTPEIPLLVTDIMAGDVLILTYDGTQFWINPNPAININATFTASNDAHIGMIFKALARKRIQPTVTVQINLAMAYMDRFKLIMLTPVASLLQGQC